MFTGIIECQGEFLSLAKSSDSARLTVRPGKKFADPVIGESVSVNGCCLSLEKVHADGSLEFFTLQETLKKTNLGLLKSGSRVNLERAMAAGGRMGGHIVQGHVDAAARVRSLKRLSDGDFEFAVEMPAELAPEIAMKGSITIDGVSLTVAALGEDYFAVRLIPQTLSATALKERHPGDLVNLETDVIAKYLRRQLSLLKGEEKGKTASWNALREAGLL